jgi:hypothetical protein
MGANHSKLLAKTKDISIGNEEIIFFEENIQEQADELIDSFRSSFWINEHQWFVRYFTSNKDINLCTLHEPKYSSANTCHSWKSTSPHDDNQKFCNDIKSIYNETFLDQPIPSWFRCSNIANLYIEFPVNDQFWSVIPSLKRLKLLTVSSYCDIFQSELQTLLDRIPHLYSLTIRQDESLPLQTALFQNINTVVCELYLHECKHYFNEDECTGLTHSPVGMKCEVLSISIVNRMSIIYFVENMKNLRSLSVKCQDDKYSTLVAVISNDNKDPTGNIPDVDELVQWLKDCLPWSSIVREPDNISSILIWI